MTALNGLGSQSNRNKDELKNDFFAIQALVKSEKNWMLHRPKIVFFIWRPQHRIQKVANRLALHFLTDVNKSQSVLDFAKIMVAHEYGHPVHIESKIGSVFSVSIAAIDELLSRATLEQLIRIFASVTSTDLFFKLIHHIDSLGVSA